MKAFAISVLFLFSTFGTAHAYTDQVYEMGLYAMFASLETDHPNAGPIPISAISNPELGITFSGDVYFQSTDPGVSCCYLDFGNEGSFTVKFDQPVKSAGIELIYFEDQHEHPTIAIANTTVSISYDDGPGGYTLKEASWLPQDSDHDYWRWDSTFNDRESAFGVSAINGFTEATFNVDGGTAFYAYRSVYTGPAQIAGYYLFYEPLNWTSPPPIPEPETYAMMLAGLGMLGFTAKRRKKT